MNLRYLLICVLGIILTAFAIGDAEDVQIPVIDSSSQPTAPTDTTDGDPLRFTLADWLSPDHHGSVNNTGNIVVFRAYVPWSVLDIPQLSRLTVPFTTHSAGPSDDDLITEDATGPTGLGDIEFYDISEFKIRSVQLQVGPVFTFPTGTRSGVGKGKWTAGPALGINTHVDKWKFGIFSLGYFSFAGSSDSASVSKMKVQPIIDYSLPHGWTVGTSDMNFTYDWTKGEMTNIPIGFAIGRSFELFSQKLNLTGQAEYNFGDTSGSAAWTFRITLEFVLPNRG